MLQEHALASVVVELDVLLDALFKTTKGISFSIEHSAHVLFALNNTTNKDAFMFASIALSFDCKT